MKKGKKRRKKNLCITRERTVASTDNNKGGNNASHKWIESWILLNLTNPIEPAKSEWPWGNRKLTSKLITNKSINLN